MLAILIGLTPVGWQFTGGGTPVAPSHILTEASDFLVTEDSLQLITEQS